MVESIMARFCAGLYAKPGLLLFRVVVVGDGGAAGDVPELLGACFAGGCLPGYVAALAQVDEAALK